MSSNLSSANQHCLSNSPVKVFQFIVLMIQLVYRIVLMTHSSNHTYSSNDSINDRIVI